jgi:hypothetical protein
MSFPAIQWFSDKKELLNAMAALFRVQAAGVDRAALSNLAPELRKLKDSTRNAEPLAWLGFSQALLYLHLGKHKRALETIEAAIPQAAGAAQTILPGLVAGKAFSLSAASACDEPQLRVLRKQLKLCFNSVAELRSAATGAVAMAHFFNNDFKRAKKFMLLASEINPQQVQVELEFDFPSQNERFDEWKNFVRREFVDTARGKPRARQGE